MYYLQDTCPVCYSGPVGFRTCSDRKTVVLLCEECGAAALRGRSERGGEESVAPVVTDGADDLAGRGADRAIRRPGGPCVGHVPGYEWLGLRDAGRNVP